MSSNNKHDRLTTLDSSQYRLWRVQTEATFELHKVLHLVLRTELPPPPTAAAKVIAEYERRHNLARETLLTCLKPTELTRVIHLKTAQEI